MGRQVNARRPRKDLPSGERRQVRQERPGADGPRQPRQRRRIVVPRPFLPLTAPTNPLCCAPAKGKLLPTFDSAGGWINCTQWRHPTAAAATDAAAGTTQGQLQHQSLQQRPQQLREQPSLVYASCYTFGPEISSSYHPCLLVVVPIPPSNSMLLDFVCCCFIFDCSAEVPLLEWVLGQHVSARDLS